MRSGPWPAGVRRPVVFLDRDGVLIANRADHVKVPDEVVLLHGSVDAVRRITAAGAVPVVITNQAVVGRGQLTLDRALDVHHHVTDLFVRAGAPLPASLLCPHAPEAGCGCRKPAPGMLLAAADRLGLDLRQACLVGDALTDLEAARAAGVPSVLVRTGRGADQERQARPGQLRGIPVADSLVEAVDVVLRLAGAGLVQ